MAQQGMTKTIACMGMEVQEVLEVTAHWGQVVHLQQEELAVPLVLGHLQ
jgi:hypothetical protein